MLRFSTLSQNQAPCSFLDGYFSSLPKFHIYYILDEQLHPIAFSEGMLAKKNARNSLTKLKKGMGNHANGTEISS